ncbi:synaptic vesicle glycoprotein 2A-like [Macrosteles quadrilineatus]|uniref:synaptic vesicle glycoprotein 2A-like n=1 Tax=Macrosteles quadrilineatus TaxID=74068 RepID=UPI0023E0A420|nr:synaptic vesicle glycoprotein 2A-like [Macrosteles quadrilineatus]
MTEKKDKWENVDFDQAMEIAGYGKFSMYIIFLSGLTICTSLLSSVDVSFLLPAAECDLQLTSQDKGLLSSAYFLGIIATSHLSGFIADTMGRRYILLRGLSLNVFTYILGSLSPNFWIFFTFKVLSGVMTCPCMIATFPFLGEYVPSKRRTQAMLITTSLSTMALLYTSLVGWLTLSTKWSVDLGLVTFTPWRLFFLLCGFPSLCCAGLFYLTPESPKFLLTRGKKGDTIKILQTLHRFNSGKQSGHYPVKSVSADSEDRAPKMQKQKGVSSLLNHIADQTFPLFRPPYVKNLMLCIIMVSVSFLCVNSIFIWLPEVTNRMASYKSNNEGKFYLCDMMSRNMTLFFDNQTAQSEVECDGTISSAVFIPNLLISIAQPIIMLLASVVVPLVDRRAVIVAVMVSGSAMALLITLIADASIIIILFGTLPIFIGVSFNVITDILIEVFPTYIRAMAVSLTMICGRIGSITGSYLFSLLIDTQCLLLFRLISGILLCCSCVPVFLQIKSRKSERTLNVT